MQTTIVATTSNRGTVPGKPPRRGKSSVYKGVIDLGPKRRLRWKVSATLSNKPVHLGHFDNEQEAARQYDAWARINMPTGAYLNYPDDRAELVVPNDRSRASIRINWLRGPRPDSTSGYKGVCRNHHRSQAKPWVALGRTGVLGYYQSAERAALQYDCWVRENGPPGAYLNFPDQEQCSTEPQGVWFLGATKASKSGFKGVFVSDSIPNPWIVRPQAGKVRITIGYFPTAEEAARAYDRWAIANGPPGRYLNFPEEHS